MPALASLGDVNDRGPSWEQSAAQNEGRQRRVVSAAKHWRKDRSTRRSNIPRARFEVMTGYLLWKLVPVMGMWKVGPFASIMNNAGSYTKSICPVSTDSEVGTH